MHVDQLKLLLTLAHRRLPNLEEEIFKDKEVTRIYLTECLGRPENPNYAMAFYYARDVIGGRWPVAEPIIKDNAFWAFVYARDVIKDRWPEAEETIKTDLGCVVLYTTQVIKGRWPEVEKLILKSKHRTTYLACV